MRVRSSSLAGSAAMLTGVGLLSQGLGLLYRVLLARLVGAETMGLYQLVMPVYSVCMALLVSGLALSVSNLTARYTAEGNDRAASQLLSAALRALGLFWLPAALLLLRFRNELAELLLGDGRTALALALIPPIVLLTGVENLHKHHFYGLGVTALPAGVGLAEQLLRSCAILGLLAALLPLTQEQAVAVMLLGMLISEVFSAVTLPLLRRRRESSFSALSGQGEPLFRLRRRLAAMALPLGCSALLNNLISSATSVLIPQRLQVWGLTRTEATELFGAVFGMALPLLTVPFAFVGALELALLPHLSRTHTLHRREKFCRTVSGALLASSAAVFPFLAVVVPLGDSLGELIFRETSLGRWMPLLAAAVGCSAWEGILATAMNAARQQTRSAGISFICGALLLALTWFGVGRFGLSVYLIGLTLDSALGVLLRLLCLAQAVGANFSAGRLFIAPTLSALAAGCCVDFCHRLGGGSRSHLSLLCCALAGLSVFAAALAVQGVFPRKVFFCAFRPVRKHRRAARAPENL